MKKKIRQLTDEELATIYADHFKEEADRLNKELQHYKELSDHYKNEMDKQAVYLNEVVDSKEDLRRTVRIKNKENDELLTRATMFLTQKDEEIERLVKRNKTYKLTAAVLSLAVIAIAVIGG